MKKIMSLISRQGSQIATMADVARFEIAADVHDKLAFLKELNDFVSEKTDADADAGVETKDVYEDLRKKADALVASEEWRPSKTDIQRGRMALLDMFDDPHNLPVAQFASLARKSRQQVYRDIAERRLLVLDIGGRKQRIPDWQLEHAPLALTRKVLSCSQDVDSWTLYQALSEPLEPLNDLPPVRAVSRRTVDEVARYVLDFLGIH